jgi:hypothetical protein
MCGRPVACYIREASLGRRLKAAGSPLRDSLVRQPATTATRLRGLAHAAAEHQLPEAPDFDAALHDLLTLIRRIT